MNNDAINKMLVEKHDAFGLYLASLTEDEFLFAPQGKWAAGQHLDHIIRSVSAVRQALLLPKFFLRIIFPKANRPSKSYEALVEKYKSKLQVGGKASGRFVPSISRFEDREKMIKKLNDRVSSLVKLARMYSEQQLDSFILPHPLLGKLTLREMLYFTIYHAKHHHQLVIKYSGNQSYA